MDDVALIDLHHMGRPRALGVYLIGGDEPVLVDCGPASCAAALDAGLAAHGLRLTDVKHLLLTHIHLDHAGGAGALVARHPGLQVHVSPVGASHLIDPTRLERSARRVFGERFDALWGTIAPVPASNVRTVGSRAAGLECVPTPGHAIHHTAFFTADGTCFSGDVTGVRIAPTDYVAAGTPPPDVDLEAYALSLDEIERRAPRRLCLAHFGIFEDVATHLDRQRAVLERWSGWVREGATEPEFIARATAEQEGLDPDAVYALEAAADFRPSYAGLVRYWQTKERADGA
jgi:glyoxylase-like metal-dependent hydrolase (beta-lactamase superfamily II)